MTSADKGVPKRKKLALTGGVATLAIALTSGAIFLAQDKGDHGLTPEEQETLETRIAKADVVTKAELEILGVAEEDEIEALDEKSASKAYKNKNYTEMPQDEKNQLVNPFLFQAENGVDINYKIAKDGKKVKRTPEEVAKARKRLQEKALKEMETQGYTDLYKDLPKPEKPEVFTEDDAKQLMDKKVKEKETKASPAPPSAYELTTVVQGGGVNPYVPEQCELGFKFRDTSVSNKYDLSLKPKGGKVLYGTTEISTIRENGENIHYLLVGCANLKLGTTYELTFKEDGKVVTTKTVKWEATKAPKNITLNANDRNGTPVFTSNRGKLKLDGKWADDAKIMLQVSVSKGKEYTPEDMYSKLSPVTPIWAPGSLNSWPISKKLDGKHLWVSVVGVEPGKKPVVFKFPAAKVDLK